MKSLWFRRLVRIEIVLIFLVILAGSVVRMTGSGMGCPDWPKCFGYIVPPTEEGQVLWTPGREYHKGQIIVHDEALYSAANDFVAGEEYDDSNWVKYTKHDYAIFNPVHTWVEYVNRLFGALSGVPMLLLFVMSLISIRKKPLYFVLSALGLFLLGFEAWLGKEVVDGHLIPGQITYHMMGAFAIVMVLVFFLSRLSDHPGERTRFDKWFLPILILLLAQTVLGTQVREQVDALTKQFGHEAGRVGWVDQIDALIYVHRSLSLLVSAAILWLWYRLKKEGKSYAFTTWTVVMVLCATTSGALLFYFDLPRILQPVHLMLSAGMVATLSWGVFRRKAH
ncbi:MAG: heme A synthase [Bacteroidetes bacterium]|nr:MAG: heme A synthase [Bacteroidota bacterium]